MKHVGDITQLNGADLPIVDIITGGSPCQNLSVAGKREGLEGSESKLFFEQIRVVKEMREHDRASRRSIQFLRPRYMVWENVKGALISNQGRDFQQVLTEIIRIAEPDAPDLPLFGGGKRWKQSGYIYDEMGKWSVAWRVHDAQYWGVPQRRKRLALLADFNGLTAGEIMFDPQYRRETTPCQTDEDVGNCGEKCRPKIQPIPESLQGAAEQGEKERQEDTRETRRSADNAIVYGFGAYNSEGMKSGNPHSGIYLANTSRTLDNNGGNPACNQGGMIVIEGNGSRASHKGDGISNLMFERHAIIDEQPLCIEMTSTKNTISTDGICPTLTARMGTGGNQVNAILQ